MAQLPIRSLRLRSYTTTDLDRLTGERGEIFYDSQLQTLKVYNGAGTTATGLAKSNLTNVSNPDFLAKATAAGFSGGVQAGLAGRIAYYPSTGSQVNDLAEVYWHTHDGTSMLHINGELDVSGQKNKIRFHWDSLADLVSQVPAADWHGMVAHAHDTGKLYYAHAGAWVAVASEAMVPSAYQFFVAADDSTQRLIGTDEVIMFTGTGGITTTSDSDGAITISGATITGSVTFVGTTIDSADSSVITFTPSVKFDSDITVGTDIVFPDGSRQSTSAVGIPGPKGDQGDPGASGAGSGDVLSSGGSYVDNRIVRYDGATGTIIQVSSASISDAGLLTATSFSGAGALITALNATELTSGTVPDARFPATLPAASGVNLTALNATQLTSGTVPDARFPATLPAASGVNLTALNATQLTSGTVPIGRIGATGTASASTYLRGDNSWATVSGGAASDSFSTIAVAGQSSVAADSATDTLTLVAGTNITITTDAGTDSITINSTASGGTASNSFATIAVAGQSSVISDSSTDTLTLEAGTGISITTNAGSDTITITNSVSAGATAFTGLTDAAGLTVDLFYLQAITRLDVTANGINHYRFDQYGTTDNPTIYAISGTTIAFNFASLGSHPFLIRFSGANYSTGLTHVTTGGTVTTGASAQGKSSGTLYWKIPAGISGDYGYLCQSHGGMNGTITIKAISTI